MSTPLDSRPDPHGSGSDAGQHIGALELADLQLMNERDGRDPLPYPFMLTRRTRFEYAEEVARYAAQLSERVRSGDLSMFARCLDALNHADITVAGHVQYVPADEPSVRLLAYRSGQAGYLMQQRANEDVLDVSLVSPFELGASIASAMPLTQPGRHSIVLNGDHASHRAASVEDDDLVVRHDVQTVEGVPVSASQVTAFAKIQSNWRPSQTWGIDKGKECLLWVRVIDDGDYLGAPDESRGIPLTAALLNQRIEDLIAGDLESLRESRGDL